MIAVRAPQTLTHRTVHSQKTATPHKELSMSIVSMR